MIKIIDICINDIWIIGVKFQKSDESIFVFKDDVFIFSFNPNVFKLKYLKQQSTKIIKTYQIEKRSVDEFTRLYVRLQAREGQG